VSRCPLPARAGSEGRRGLARLALVADLVIIGVYIGSDPAAQPLAGIAVAASLIRIVACALVIGHATALRQHVVRLCGQPFR
jgi:hypothetical protein